MGKHDTDLCYSCYVPSIGEGCEVYTDRSNVILTENNTCYSKCKTLEEWNKRVRSLEEG